MFYAFIRTSGRPSIAIRALYNRKLFHLPFHKIDDRPIICALTYSSAIIFQIEKRRRRRQILHRIVTQHGRKGSATYDSLIASPSGNCRVFAASRFEARMT